MDREKVDKDKAGSAIWFNKREVARIDLAADHQLSPQNDGWRIDFGANGSIRIEMAKGGKESLGVAAGDSLLSSGEDFYLTLARGDAERKDREERSAAKRATREARKSVGKSSKESASNPVKGVR